MEQQRVDRETAYKVSIKSLLENPFTKQEGWQPNYIKIYDKEVSRVNIIGIVIDKQNSKGTNFESFMVDDGTSPISVRSFEQDKTFDNYNVGDIIQIFGRPRQYNDDVYIVPEIIKKIKNKGIIELRKKELRLDELKSQKTKTISQKIPEIREEKVAKEEEAKEYTPSEKVYNLIKNLDTEFGASYEEVIEKSQMPEEETEKIIKTLLLEGDIFEVKPGRLKIL